MLIYEILTLLIIFTITFLIFNIANKYIINNKKKINYIVINNKKKIENFNNNLLYNLKKNLRII